MAEQFDAIDDELLRAIAKVKGHAVQKAAPRPVAEIYPLTVKERALLKAEKEAEEEAWKNPVPGQLMPDGTTCVGKYAPTDRSGKSLSLTFNVFAAPEDLPKKRKGGLEVDDILQFDETVKDVANVKHWHGYDGANYANDTKLYDALRKGKYNGGWIIPTQDILCGKDVNGTVTMPDNLMVHKKTSAFNQIFDNLYRGYWSLTHNLSSNSQVRGVSIGIGQAGWSEKDNWLACRPVRLVPCP